MIHYLLDLGPTRRRIVLVALVPSLLVAASLFPRTVAGQPVAPSKVAIPPARTSYMGRTIAGTMSFRGAAWLIRSEREKEERCSLMLANLGARQGMSICDMGCGNGFYSLQLAKMVGPEGEIYAVDIQQEMLDLLKQRASDEGIANVRLVKGEVHDPNLPVGKIDLILLVDVYHEFSHPQLMLRAMRESLKPDGLIALLEYRGEDDTVPIKKLHKMSKKQILKEYPANGLRLVKEFEGLPWQHMMFFGRDESWNPDLH